MKMEKIETDCDIERIYYYQERSDHHGSESIEEGRELTY